ncbi:MAG TPA: efflux transporter outer membrane subunit [Caulobacteraceae bacterium]
MRRSRLLGAVCAQKARAWAACALLALSLTACASGGARTADTRLPPAYDALKGGAPKGQAELAAADLDRWWLLFNDQTLNALEDEAFRLSPDARTADARLLEARATRSSQVAQTLPQTEAQGNANHKQTSNLDGNSNNLIPVGGASISETLNFNVSWEIDLFGRLAIARRTASADLAATRFNIEGSRAALAANVADSYFQVRGLAIQLADARETVRIQTQLQDIAAKKAQLGLGAASDADRVAGDLAQALSNAESLEAELHANQRTLLILVGRGIDPVSTVTPATVAGDVPAAPDSIPGDLLQRRPDVREAEAKVRSAAGRDKIAHRAFFPTFTFQPSGGLSHLVSPGVSFIPPATLSPSQQTTNTSFWAYGVGVSQPVLDVPRLLADMHAQDARTEQAVIAYEKTVQTAFGEAESALVRLSADQRRVALLKDGETRSHRAYDAARTRYAQGLDDLQTALGAEQSWRTTKSALTAEQVQALRRAVQTYKALGGGWAYADRAGGAP